MRFGQSVWEHGSYSVTIVSAEEFLRHSPDGLQSACEALAKAAADENIFYEWFNVCAALKNLNALGDDPDVRQTAVFALVWAGDDQLVGFFPYQVDQNFRGLRLSVLSSWHHRYCFLCTPLIHAEYAAQVTQALFAWLTSNKGPTRFLELSFILEESAFGREFRRLVRDSRSWSIYQALFSRASLVPKGQADSDVSGKHRKEMRRLERRLGERGELTYTRLSDDNELERWTEEFLQLEASGWKGRQGDAFACTPGDKDYFKELLSGAWARGQLQLLALRLDQRAIAMKCNFITGQGSFSFKIAYDESYGAFSPGVLLELFNIRDLDQSYPAVQWMDSCAAEKHFMANRLWPERRQIARYILARGLPARSVMKAGQGLSALKRQWLGDAA
jgi:hypothetical protein